MKTDFISTAAHQLRTPLTSIQGFSEILMTSDDIKEEEKKEFISYINKQSVNLANIINDLLDISRIESGIGFTLHKVPCDINEIIKERVEYFQASYPERQFDIILPREPVEVKVDKDKIGQALENILSNAVKYSPGGGSVCVTAEKIAEAKIEISVADQGIGMSPDQVEQIFDKFYRADASNSAISGTGLGTSIIKNYVEAHGGKVWVESELGKGTVVKFLLKI
jgi:signal transduction histidine kinase